MGVKLHPKIRKTVKWGGAVVTVLLVVVWIGSGWAWVQRSDARGDYIVLGGGLAKLRIVTGVALFCNPPIPPPGLDVRRPARFSPGWDFRFGRPPMFESRFVQRGYDGMWFIDLPIWAFATCASLISLCAWRLDIFARRRARIGFCPKCNYDRTGLVAGAVCPECGRSPS